MVNQRFLLLAFAVISSVASLTMPPKEQVEKELLAAGLQKKYLDTINEFFSNRRKAELETEELAKKTGKKINRMREYQKNTQLMDDFFETLPKDQNDIYEKIMDKYW